MKVLSIGSVGDLKDIFEQAGVSVDTINKNFKGDIRIMWQLAKYFEQEKPDIVHTHLFGSDFWGGLAALKSKVPIIVSTKHDVMSEGLLKRFFVKKIRKHFTRIIAVSDAAKTYLVEQDKIPAGLITVIQNGVDMNKFYAEGAQILNNDEIIFGTVGRLIKVKGYENLIKAFSLIKNKNWSLRMVGDGEERKSLEKLAKNHGLQEQVHFLGAVEANDELPKMDVFVHPSYSEGLSLAVMEAAAAGKFLIASDVGGLPEIVEHGKTGLLINPHSLEDLVEKLNWVFNHRDESKLYAKALQKRTVTKFDINNIINQYQDLYKTLIEKVKVSEK